MPGYVTHYIFGRDMYEKLNDPVLKNNLYKETNREKKRKRIKKSNRL